MQHYVFNTKVSYAWIHKELSDVISVRELQRHKNAAATGFEPGTPSPQREVLGAFPTPLQDEAQAAV